MRVFYWLANDRGKAIFDKLIWILCGVMLVNYMFFGTDLGILSANLQYENGLNFTLTQQLLNLLVLIVVGVVMYFIFSKWNRILSTVLLTAVIAVGGMSGFNILNINQYKMAVENHNSYHRLETDFSYIENNRINYTKYINVEGQNLTCKQVEK